MAVLLESLVTRTKEIVKSEGSSSATLPNLSTYLIKRDSSLPAMWSTGVVATLRKDVAGSASAARTVKESGDSPTCTLSRVTVKLYFPDFSTLSFTLHKAETRFWQVRLICSPSSCVAMITKGVSSMVSLVASMSPMTGIILISTVSPAGGDAAFSPKIVEPSKSDVIWKKSAYGTPERAMKDDGELTMSFALLSFARTS
mmetsp:Transcript_25363/g.80261  ORF Transcript_25363/g.80261 Transcript_25363/m.80261 type:complete len:200 (+) Transcript_25363:12318-12917(+)